MPQTYEVQYNGRTFEMQAPQPPTEELWNDIYANPWDNSLLPKTKA